MELIFATNNRNKVEEIQAVIGEKFRLRTLEGIGCYDDIPETGETFEENAGQKSLYLHERYGLDCFADDSGLEVAALGGKPGVHSARYSGSRDMEQNMDLLLRELGDNPDRRARFRTVISLRIRNKEYLFEGSVPGRIIYERTGSKGFGYDPLFIPDGYDRTFAEMELAEKTAISHRTIAVRKMADFLTTFVKRRVEPVTQPSEAAAIHGTKT